ncbi:hypothetical protein DLAC_02439 [Tieghemostelium lacteum]|uniref:Asteroid domain-containing protein n=1 Tax=Tieghemostelium lacteum TaxID=361077 RepID=A0A152A2X1_TIELA|nr:hypothetical protein DLAC_02439 [Tieghemostelium lacteum]|eukprot:KYR00445.1 hypothetical protein DLAC_02439 [Tieghemostelium lacteum]
MGVHGFTGYINKRSELGIPLTITHSDEKRIIGIDGLSFLYTISELENYKTARLFREYCIKFFKLLQSFNFEILVFVDGFSPVSKFKEHQARFNNKWNRFSGYGDTLAKGQHLSNLNCFPKLFVCEFKSICRELDIELRHSTEEADDDIVEWVADNPGIVHAIISNDSDFYFYDFGNTYFFPISKMKVDFETSVFKVQAFTTTNLAEGLYFSPKYLGLFTALAGNDTTKHYDHRKHTNNKVSVAISIISTNSKNLDENTVTYESLIKSTLKVTDNDIPKILDSVARYSVASDKSKGGVDERTATFLRSSERREKVLANKFGKYLFSRDSIVLYLCDYLFIDGDSSLYETYQIIIEKKSHLKHSFLQCFKPIRTRFFGYLCTEKNKKYLVKELLPDVPKAITVMFQPTTTAFTYQECWNGSVSFETRIKEFASIFGLCPTVTDKFLSPEKFDYFRFYLYNCLGFILNLNDTNHLNIELSNNCIDTILLHFLLCKDTNTPKEMEKYKGTFYYEPFYFMEIYAKTLEQCYNFNALFALDKDITGWTASERERVTRPTNNLDREILHNLWVMKLKNETTIPKTVTGDKERLKHLFPTVTLSDDLLNEFVEIKAQLKANINYANQQVTKPQQQQAVEAKSEDSEESTTSTSTTTTTTSTSTKYIPPSKRNQSANSNNNNNNKSTGKNSRIPDKRGNKQDQNTDKKSIMYLLDEEDQE